MLVGTPCRQLEPACATDEALEQLHVLFAASLLFLRDPLTNRLVRSPSPNNQPTNQLSILDPAASELSIRDPTSIQLPIRDPATSQLLIWDPAISQLPMRNPITRHLPSRCESEVRISLMVWVDLWHSPAWLHKPRASCRDPVWTVRVVLDDNSDL